MRDAFDVVALLDACNNIFAQQELTISEATATAQAQLRNLLTELENLGQHAAEIPVDDLKMQTQTLLQSAYASGKLKEAISSMQQEEKASPECLPANASSAESACSSQLMRALRPSPLQVPAKEQLLPVQILHRDHEAAGAAGSSTKSEHDMPGLPDRCSARRPSQPPESDADISILFAKNHSFDASTSANGIRTSISSKCSSVAKTLLHTVPGHGVCKFSDAAVAASPYAQAVSRSRRPSVGAESAGTPGPTSPYLPPDFADYWGNEPESAYRSRRPSWNASSNAPGADHDSNEATAGFDDDDDVMKLLPVWTRKLKLRTPKTPRRPSTASGRSDQSDDSPHLMTQSTSFAGRPSWQEYQVGKNEGIMAASRDGGRMARFKTRWEHFAMRIILKPSSMPRISWDLFSAFIICYDMIWIPLQIFQPPTPAFVMGVFWTATVFWSFDIFVSFVSGYNTEGITELRPRKIAAHYMRTWLVFDVLVVVVDWVWLVGITAAELKAEGSSRHAARLGIAFRCLRMLRLLRLLKANGVLSNLIDSVRSEFWLIMLGLAKRMLAIITMSHFVACAWYGLGILTEAPSWVHEGGFSDTGVAWRYTTSLHWALTQFTPASMEVVPENAVERTFNIGVVLVAMVTFSYFISSITNAMNRIQSLSGERLRKLSKLRKYLAENKISVELTGRIWSCAQQALMKKAVRRIHEREVEILPLLPLRLKADLIEEVYFTSFQRYPFFAHLSDKYNIVMRKLYSCAVDEQALGKGRELFLFGEPGDRMFFVFGGTLKFTDCRAEVRNLPTALPVMMSVGQWACEAVLWVSWKHAGQLIADSHCELVSVKADKVQEVLYRMEEPRRYAREFITFFEKNPMLLRDVLDEDMLRNMAECAFTPLEEEIETGKENLSEPCSPNESALAACLSSVVPLPGEAPSQLMPEEAIMLLE